MINSLGVTALGFNLQGVPVGPLSALVNLSQMIAGAIGWNGIGNPLASVTLPTIDKGVGFAEQRVSESSGSMESFGAAIDVNPAAYDAGDTESGTGTDNGTTPDAVADLDASSDADADTTSNLDGDAEGDLDADLDGDVEADLDGESDTATDTATDTDGAADNGGDSDSDTGGDNDD